MYILAALAFLVALVLALMDESLGAFGVTEFTLIGFLLLALAHIFLIPGIDRRRL